MRRKKGLAGLIKPAVVMPLVFCFIHSGAAELLGYSGDGEGTEESPYEITDWSELQEMNDYLNDSNVHFKLMNDLNEESDGYDEHNTEQEDYKSEKDAGWQETWDEGDTIDIPFDEYEYDSILSVEDDEGNSINHTIDYPTITIEENTEERYVYVEYENMVLGWNPVGDFDDSFDGTFDGSGYTISDLFIDRSERERVGLFGFAGSDAEIKDTGVLDADITGGDNTGALAGLNWGKITDSFSTGDVSGEDSTGGLIGMATGNGEISNSYSSAEIKGNEEVGGLIGYSWNAEVSNSYSTGEVSGDSKVGGLVGWNRETIINSYSIGEVSGNENTGGLVGNNWGEVINSYYDKQTSGQNDDEGKGTPRTTEEMKDILTYIYGTWDIYIDTEEELNDGYPYLAWQDGEDSHIWIIYAEEWPELYEVTFDEENNLDEVEIDIYGDEELEEKLVAGLPTNESGEATISLLSGTYHYSGSKPDYVDFQGSFEVEQEPKTVNFKMSVPSAEINSWEDLYNIRFDLSRDFVLMTDLDSESEGYDDYASSNANDGKGWDPIGDYSESFRETFDGGGHTISDLYIDRSEEDYVGLFGNTEGTVENIGLLNADITGQDYTGALVGSNWGKITDSYSTGDVSGRQDIGGLVGDNQDKVLKSHSSVEVSGDIEPEGISRNAGGLVGNNEGEVLDSYSTGDVSSTGDYFSVGGLVGRNDGDSLGATGEIRNSYSTGDVYSEGDDVGGLVGRNWYGEVHDSYSAGEVSGIHNVGGLVGRNRSGEVHDSYSIGFTTGTSTVGGLVGYSWHGEITNSFSDEETTGQDDPVGTASHAAIDNVKALPTEKMQDFLTYYYGDWDIDIETEQELYDGYPYLAWQEGAESSVWLIYATEYPDLYDVTFAEENSLEGVEIDIYEDEGYEEKVIPGQLTDESGEVTVELSSGTYYFFVSTTGYVDYQGSFQVEETSKTVSFTMQVAPTEIHSWEDLYNIKYDLSENYVLKTDLDSGSDGYEDYASSNANAGKGWEPIGEYLDPFEGTFDGNGHTISDLYIDRDDENRVGLFGDIAEVSKINDVGLLDADITGNYYTGALVGNNLGTIANSYAAAEVSGGSQTGGLVGYNLEGGTIASSYSRGKVEGGAHVGGLAGDNRGIINNSYSTSEVEGEGNRGGLVGYNGGKINYSYSTGKVENTDTQAGGLVGYNPGEVNYSYYNQETSGQRGSTGGEGRDTEEMIFPYDEETYEGWDFETVWQVTDWNEDQYEGVADSMAPEEGPYSGYPALALQYPPLTVETAGLEKLTYSTATLSGELVYISDYSQAEVYFKWKEDGEEEWDITEGEMVSSPGSFSYMVSSLLPETTYYFKALVEAGEEAKEGEILSFYTPPIPPEPVSPPKGEFTSDNQPEFEWAYVGKEQVEFKLQVSTDSEFGSVNYSTDAVTSNTATQLSESMDNGNYFWRVKRKNSDNFWSSWSEVFDLTVDTTPPDAPQLKSPADLSWSSSTVTFRWKEVDAGVSGLDLYELQVSTEAGFGIYESSITSDREVEVTELGQVTYWWRVNAKDRAGNYSQWSSTQAVLIDNTSPVIEDFDIEADYYHTNLTVSATDYFSGLAENPYMFAMSTYSQCASPERTHWLDSNKYMWPGLNDDTTYWFKVQLKDVAGNTVWSSTQSVKTLSVEEDYDPVKATVEDSDDPNITMTVRTVKPTVAEIREMDENQKEKADNADNNLPEGAETIQVTPRNFLLRYTDGSPIYDYGDVLEEGDRIVIQFKYPETLSDSEIDRLRVVRLKEDEQEWEFIPKNKTTLIKEDLLIQAKLDRLSVFSLVLDKAELTDVDKVFAYPNPFKPGDSDYGGAYGDKGIIIANLPGGSDIRIFNIAGELVDSFTHRGGAESYRWEKAEDLASGVYIMVVESEGNVKTRKFSVVR